METEIFKLPFLEDYGTRSRCWHAATIVRHALLQSCVVETNAGADCLRPAGCTHNEINRSFYSPMQRIMQSAQDTRYLRCIHAYTHTHTHTRTHADRQTDRQTDRPTDRQTDRHRQTDRQTDRQADRQADRQTDSQLSQPTSQPSQSADMRIAPPRSSLRVPSFPLWEDHSS